MPRPRKPFVQQQVTRHGRKVWYFRRGRGERIRLRRPDDGQLARIRGSLSARASPERRSPVANRRQGLAWLGQVARRSLSVKPRFGRT